MKRGVALTVSGSLFLAVCTQLAISTPAGDMAAAAGRVQLDGGSERLYLDSSPFAGDKPPVRSILGTLHNSLGNGQVVDGVVLEFRPTASSSGPPTPGAEAIFEAARIGDVTVAKDAVKRHGSGIYVQVDIPPLNVGEEREFWIGKVAIVGPLSSFDVVVTPLVKEKPAGTAGRAVPVGKYSFSTKDIAHEAETSFLAGERFAAIVHNAEEDRPIRALRGTLSAPDGHFARVRNVTLQTVDAKPTLVAARSKIDANGFRLEGFEVSGSSQIECVVEFDDPGTPDRTLRLQLAAEYE
jgi:hypothetical protein